MMRGADEGAGSLSNYVDLESRIPSAHPLRAIRAIVNEVLSTFDADFAGLYSRIGRPSIPPEQLLRAMLLPSFYAIRSEPLLVERLDFDPSFRWFVGLGIDDGVWDVPIFSKNRDGLLDGDVAVTLLDAILGQPRVKRPLSTERFSVDGTLIEAWASMKGFRPKGRGDEHDPPASSALRPVIRKPAATARCDPSAWSPAAGKDRRHAEGGVTPRVPTWSRKAVSSPSAETRPARSPRPDDRRRGVRSLGSSIIHER
ncbi:transposase [Pinisolibacter sp. B13]|nr:transposase [Pinisolibacter aquiterrae]